MQEGVTNSESGPHDPNGAIVSCGPCRLQHGSPPHAREVTQAAITLGPAVFPRLGGTATLDPWGG